MNKLSYPRPHKYRTRFFSGATPVVFGVAVVVLAIIFILRLFAPGAIMTISQPLWKAGASLSAAAASANVLDSRADLGRARDALAADKASLIAQNAALATQVADLTALLGTREAPEKGIVASVLARPPVAPYDVLLIDQGTASGIELNARVQGNGGTPIGTITEAGARSSRVTLYSAVGVTTEGWAGVNRIPLTLTGVGSGAFTVTVLKDAGVMVGDGIYLAGNGAFPIGTVTSIESDPSSPSVVLDIRPYTNPFSTTWVTVARD